MLLMGVRPPSLEFTRLVLVLKPLVCWMELSGLEWYSPKPPRITSFSPSWYAKLTRGSNPVFLRVKGERPCPLTPAKVMPPFRFARLAYCDARFAGMEPAALDRKSTRLNSSH